MVSIAYHCMCMEVISIIIQHSSRIAPIRAPPSSLDDQVLHMNTSNTITSLAVPARAIACCQGPYMRSDHFFVWFQLVIIPP